MNSPTEQIRVAILSILEHRADTSQSDLADKTETQRSYMNDFLKGRAPGKEEARVKWAEYLGYTYIELLRLGQHILDGFSAEDLLTYRSAVNWNKSQEWPAGENYSKLVDTINHIPDKDRGILLTIIDRLEGWDDYLLKDLPDMVVVPIEVSSIGIIYADRNEPKKAISFEFKKYLLPDFSSVPKYKAVLSGGPGSFEDSDQIEANMMFRTEFLQQKGPINQMALFEVSGDSMAPFIHHSDVVLVDRSTKNPKEIVDGKTYAFQENGTVKVKRLSKQGSAIISSSDNHMMYPPYHIDLDMFHLIGKVLWVGHEVK